MERQAGRVGRPARVSRRLIADAALEVGVDTLTLAALAERLGVDHSTLYRHVVSRQDIVVLACDTAVSRVDWPELPDLPDGGLARPDDDSWRAYLATACERIWDMYDGYPGLATAIHHLDTAPDHAVLLFTRAIRDLTRTGFTEADAVLVLDMVLDVAVESYVGWERVVGTDRADRQPASTAAVDEESPVTRFGGGVLAIAGSQVAAAPQPAADPAVAADEAAAHPPRRPGPAHSSGTLDPAHAREEDAQRHALGTMDRVTARFAGEVVTGSAVTPRDWWRRKLALVLAGAAPMRAGG